MKNQNVAILIASVILTSMSSVSAEQAKKKSGMSLRGVFQKNLPEVNWDAGEPKIANFNGDGKNDYFLRGVKGDRLYIGMVISNPGKKTGFTSLNFGINQGDRDDTLCGKGYSITGRARGRCKLNN